MWRAAEPAGIICGSGWAASSGAEHRIQHAGSGFETSPPTTDPETDQQARPGFPGRLLLWRDDREAWSTRCPGDRCRRGRAGGGPRVARSRPGTRARARRGDRHWHQFAQQRVIHAGLYPPGSLKARLRARARQRLKFSAPRAASAPALRQAGGGHLGRGAACWLEAARARRPPTAWSCSGSRPPEASDAGAGVALQRRAAFAENRHRRQPWPDARLAGRHGGPPAARWRCVRRCAGRCHADAGDAGDGQVVAVGGEAPMELAHASSSMPPACGRRHWPRPPGGWLAQHVPLGPSR